LSEVQTAGAIPTIPPILYQGTLVDGAGVALPGILVGLYLDTNHGEPTAEDPLLATATTDTSGGIVLRSDIVGAIQAAATLNDGHVNFYIQAVSPTGALLLQYYFSRVFSDGQWSTGDSPPTLGRLTLEAGSPGAVRIDRSVALLVRRSMSESPSQRVCGGTAWLTLSSSTAWTDVGEFHTVGGMSGYFTYAKSNTTDSDIGVVTSGGIRGPWSSSGSIHVGSGSATTETWNRGSNWSHRVRTQFVYAKQQMYTGCGQPLAYYRIKATAYAAGALDGVSTSSFDHNCDIAPYNQWQSPQGAQTTLDRHDFNAVTWQQGVSVFGATISVKSGYSTNVWAHWDFSSFGILCGNDAVVPQATRIWAGT
jgi:hypothetical protein